MRGAAASGHPLTTEAACEMLRRGGNAFDAVLAAAFASSVTEPCLTSLGGGGFLLAHTAGTRRAVLHDFFVNAPGKGASPDLRPVIDPVEVKFKSTVQVFHAGKGSIAVPGTLKGLVHCWRELATMDMEDIIAPSLRYLDEGVELTQLQSYLITLLMPILTATEYGREIFLGKDRGGRLFNPLLREFMGTRSPDRWLDTFYGSGAEGFEAQVKGAGLVTARDLREYEVIEREPLACRYRGFEILTNPQPSFGGRMLAMACMAQDQSGMERAGEAERHLLLAEIMERMNASRQGATGTTHISVMDEEGNAASLTSSNGTNSGYFLGDTGVMLNNIMGEDDLFPQGFFTVTPGERVGSMMSPTLIKKGETVHAVLGSGGSKRIKTAMLQVIHNLLDRGMDVADAVEAPRMHLDDEGVLQMEPGFPQEVIETLGRKYPLNVWKEKELYFGGVHTVMGGLEGWGDSRRGGHFGVSRDYGAGSPEA